MKPVALAPCLLAALITSAGCGLVDPLDAVGPPVGDVDIEGLLQCSPDDRQRVRDYLQCLERGRDALCAAEDAAACDVPLAQIEPAAVGCQPPTDIAEICAASVAPEGHLAGGPLDCGAAQRAVDAAVASYDDDPSSRLDPARWTVRGTYATGNTFGLIAQHGPAVGGACYVAFRGTDDEHDVRDDVRALEMSPCGQLDGRCGDGFLAGFDRAVASGIFRATLDLVESGACGSLTITGHSLGGAIADIFAAHLMRRAPDTFTAPFFDVQTFGQPRVFGPRLSEAMQATMPKTRWMRWGDPVPGLLAFDTVHHGTARLIRQGFDWRSRMLDWTFSVVQRDTVDAGLAPHNHGSAMYQSGLALCR